MHFPTAKLPRAIIRTWVTFAVYLILLLLAIPPVISWIHRIVFLLYAIFIFWTLYPTLKNDKPYSAPDSKSMRRIWISLLIFSGLFLIASRLYLFIRYGEAPLGYDTGFYWQYFRQITSYGTSIGYVGAGNVAYDAWFPYYFMGFKAALSVINPLHILHQLITAGALYFLACSFKPHRNSYTGLAVITLVLFALSVNQFMAFWWMFYKQSMALPFLIFATGLFIRRSWLAVPIAAFGAAIHLQSAIPFGIAFLCFFLYQIGLGIAKKRPVDRELLYIGFFGLTTSLLIVLIKSPGDLLSYFEYFKHYRGFASNAPEWGIQQAKGLFIPFSTFRLNAIFYLPFALTGVLTMRSWLFDKISNQRLAVIPILLFVSLILASFPFLYQNRSLILLDLMMIIFAAYPIMAFIERLLRGHLGKIILGLLFAGSVIYTARVIWNHPPQIYSAEAREIRKIVQLRKPGDYAMTLTSLYTPWVYAYTDFQETIAPGWLSWDRWNLTMWQEFWNGDSNTRRLGLLNIYGNHDIYMFAGRHFTIPPNLKKFLEQDPHFTKISPHIWKFSPPLTID